MRIVVTCMAESCKYSRVIEQFKFSEKDRVFFCSMCQFAEARKGGEKSAKRDREYRKKR